MVSIEICNCRSSPTFLASGISSRATSTLAMAKTSAEADMFTKKSVIDFNQPNAHPVFSTPSSQSCSVRTLHCSLRSHSRHSSHRAYHKVLKHPVSRFSTTRLIFAIPCWDLSIPIATQSFERAIKGARRRHLGDVASLREESGGGAHGGGQLGARTSTDEGARRGCERRHDGKGEVRCQWLEVVNGDSVDKSFEV